MAEAFGNLLAQALGIIPPVPVSFCAFVENETSASGIQVRKYADAIAIGYASVQSVKTEIYHRMGLDFRKNYRSVYIPKGVQCLEDAQSPDKLTFYGKSWIIVGVSDWFNYDGWTHIIVVEEKDYV